MQLYHHLQIHTDLSLIKWLHSSFSFKEKGSTEVLVLLLCVLINKTHFSKWALLDPFLLLPQANGVKGGTHSFIYLWGFPNKWFPFCVRDPIRCNYVMNSLPRICTWLKQWMMMKVAFVFIPLYRIMGMLPLLLLLVSSFHFTYRYLLTTAIL